MTATFNLEELLTSPHGFGLTTATPLQRAKCRIVEGRPLDDLASHPDVIAALGGGDAVGLLPVNPGPSEVSDFSAIRCGKSEFAACLSVWASQHVGVSMVKPGDGAPRIPIVAPRADLAHATFQHVMGPMRASPILRRLIAGEPLSDTVYVRHPSGLVVEICTVAASAAGTNIVARFLAGLIVEEMPRHASSDAAAVFAVEDLLSSARGRLLPGAPVYKGGTPVAAVGLAYREYVENFGKPSRDLVVICSRGPALNPYWWTPERCEELKRRDPRAYARDVEAQFVSAISSCFDIEDIDAAIGREIPAGEWCQPVQSIDPSSLRGDDFCSATVGYVRPMTKASDYQTTQIVNAATGRVICESIAVDDCGMPLVKPDARLAPVLVVGPIESFGGRREGVSDFDRVVDSIASTAHREGVRHVVSDQREELALESAFSARGLRFTSIAWTAANKELAVVRLRRLLAERAIVLPADEKLRRELIAFSEIVSPSGNIRYAARQNGHDDRVAVLLTAILAESSGLLSGSPLRRGAGKSYREV